MIVALTGIGRPQAGAALARQLAQHRSASGRRVLLAGAGNPGAAGQPDDDVLIDDGGRDGDAALARAGVIVALLCPTELGQCDPAPLLARLRAARAGNPQARVLVALERCGRALTPRETGALLVLVAQLGAARLADTLELGADGCYRPCHGCGMAADAGLSAPQLQHLYQQVFS